jgi:hypothetical protein
MTEPDLRKREARLTAREARLVRRERDLAARVAELSDGPDDVSDSALDALLQRRRGLHPRLPTLVLVVVGLWLMVAPLVLGYPDGNPMGATVACGAALALLGLWRLADRTDDSAPAPWIAAGVATVLLAVATLADHGPVAAFDDAGAGLAVWAAVIAAAASL